MNLNLGYRLSNDYIRGLVEGEGCFTFYTTNQMINGYKSRLPTFSIRIHYRDTWLLEAVVSYLCLKNKVYLGKAYRKDGSSRAAQAGFLVRNVGDLKNIVVPFFYNKLAGYKGKQFFEWLDKIGTDPQVPERFKIIYTLHKSGYWNNQKNIIEKFR